MKRLDESGWDLNGIKSAWAGLVQLVSLWISMGLVGFEWFWMG